MPGSNQLPAGAEGAAAFSLIYALVSLSGSSLLLWLTIAHREGWSYICLLAASTGLSTIASIAQQINDITFYEDVLRGQFARKANVFHNPELAIANGSFGLDLVLFYFQYYSYNVQALFVMFWTGELAQSVYGLNAKPRMQETLRKVNLAGKAVSILLPLVTILLLRARAIQRQFVVFLLIADLPLMISLALGSTLMVAILSRYIKTKKSITNWTPPQHPSRSMSNSTPYTDRSPLHSATAGSRAPTPRKQSLHDRWLMVRFLVSFFILVCFEVTNILFQMQSVKNARTDAALQQPDLSAGRARTTFFLFIPGTTAGIFLFIVFGTTAGCRSKMCETFVPRKWRNYNPSKGWATRWKRRPRLAAASSVPLTTMRSPRRGVARRDNAAALNHDKGTVVVYSRRASYNYHRLMKPLPPLPTQ